MKYGTSTKLPKPPWAKIGQIRTLSTERLGKRIDMIDPEELEEIIEGLLDIIS
ncbi:MAG: type II toxin-antitoxin system PemK/MazF family toxin [Candidatus Omnitrophica bacterium]|nr:type II toxin-antitoxin system PemK/MazF family toxin [Candidatus Omnitrophota bacterium]